MAEKQLAADRKAAKAELLENQRMALLNKLSAERHGMWQKVYRPAVHHRNCWNSARSMLWCFRSATTHQELRTGDDAQGRDHKMSNAQQWATISCVGHARWLRSREDANVTPSKRTCQQA
jgi:hypothetical protein